MIDSLLEGYRHLFVLFAQSLGSYGLAAILLAIMSNFLLIWPLRWAEKVAKLEVDFQKVLQPQVNKIKKESNGEQQFNRLNALYERYSYHPLFGLRLLTGLFIQLPILMLTFFMFLNLEALNGEQFLIITDLGRPDNLLYGNGNLLPFVMTFSNILAAYLSPTYTKKSFIQATVVAITFFVLLYNVKSALLLYWTTANIILLVNNLIYAIKEPNSLNHTKKLKIDLLIILSNSRFLTSIFFGLLYTLVILYFLPAGLNRKLTQSIVLALGALITIIIIVKLFTHRRGWANRLANINQAINSQLINVKSLDVLLLLIPLSPIVQYALNNGEMISPNSQMLLVGVTYIIFITFLFLPIVLLKRYIFSGPALLFFIILSYGYISMPSFSRVALWSEDPDLIMLLFLMAVTFLFLLQMYLKHRSSLYLISCVIFMFSTTFAFFTGSTSEALAYQSKDSYKRNKVTTSQQPTSKPDIYLLTYDSYVDNQMMSKYGIDNRKQEKFLTENGFVIYDDVYSTGFFSLASMSRVLDINNDIDTPMRKIISGNSLVVNTLKTYGYETAAVLSSYFYPINPSDIKYDYIYPRAAYDDFKSISTIYRGVFEGKFRFDLNMQGKAEQYSREDWLKAKRTYMAEPEGPPRFLYNHTGPGHSQNSGKCLPNEIELFESRLSKSNEEMQEDIEAIRSSNRNAIIIINGDHGPYLSGDCLYLDSLDWNTEVTQFHLQDRLATFLAISWPEDNGYKAKAPNTIQQIFSSVFRYMFENEDVLLFEPPTYSSKFSQAPQGVIVEGIIQIGKDKGKPLFSENAEH